jgi:hypothetical protein
VPERGQPGEVHPHNPGAIRGPDGIWCEDTIPVTSWEAAGHRVVLPLSVQRATGIPVPVLRWSAIKRLRVISTRPVLLDRIERLDELLVEWIVVGLEPKAGGAWNLVFEDSGHLNTVIFGPDMNESWNVITIYPLRGNQRKRIDADWMLRRQEK